MNSGDEGHVMGALRYGYMLYNGLGVSKDYQQCAFYLHMAANKRNTEATILLGCIFEFGKDREQDLESAKEYYEFALSCGDKNAEKHLQRCKCTLPRHNK